MMLPNSPSFSASPPVDHSPQITPETPIQAGHEVLGRVLAVSGSQVTVGLSAPSSMNDVRATVGKFLGIVSGDTLTVGMITEIAERRLGDRDPDCPNFAKMDLIGEIKIGGSGTPFFQRGVTEYPMIGEPAILMGDRELRLIYTGYHRPPCNIGVLQQDRSIPARVDVDQLVSKHFAVLGTTGVGKTTGVIILLQQILQERPDLRVFLID
ncbi:MAG: DUF87 domain-containing protein, partial [Rhizobiales bacterium]|nr:DUF87 domain-containing protein [Hyphomicrobiales bacterium]